jgi:hypothetical protein
MMMLARSVIDLLRHTSSTYWMLSICCGVWRLRLMCLVYMASTYLSFIDIFYDLILKHFCWISWCMHLAYGWTTYWDM